MNPSSSIRDFPNRCMPGRVGPKSHRYGRNLQDPEKIGSTQFRAYVRRWHPKVFGSLSLRYRRPSSLSFLAGASSPNFALPTLWSSSGLLNEDSYFGFNFHGFVEAPFVLLLEVSRQLSKTAHLMHARLAAGFTA